MKIASLVLPFVLTGAAAIILYKTHAQVHVSYATGVWVGAFGLVIMNYFNRQYKE